ncbi:MAG: hypothetical protein AB7S26_11245 [Sandaracinaceae bacterium]
MHVLTRRLGPALLAALVLAPAARLSAQPSLSPPASGLYEGWSSLTMTAYGPLASPPTLVAEWIEVRTEGSRATVTMLPDRRVVWRITWGPHGPVEKVVEVDGERFLTARYAYDANGHLEEKTASGPGLERDLSFRYRTDAQGRVVERSAQGGSAAPVQPSATREERLTVRYRRRGATVEVRNGTSIRRVDRLDPAMRPLRTTVRADEVHARVELIYVRDASGALTRVDRIMGGRRGPADFRVPDPRVTSELVRAVSLAPVERGEALLLLGSPYRTTDEQRSLRRRRNDDWSNGGCWLNATSGIDWDPSGALRNATSSCICGFCVDAALAVEAPDAYGVDLHWTHGPWVRIDGVDLTIDHEVLTPTGPRAAGALALGDLVIGGDGRPRPILRVEPLGETFRLGRNVRTESGTFVVGDLTVLSESPRACP